MKHLLQSHFILCSHGLLLTTHCTWNIKLSWHHTHSKQQISIALLPYAEITKKSWVKEMNGTNFPHTTDVHNIQVHIYVCINFSAVLNMVQLLHVPVISFSNNWTIFLSALEISYHRPNNLWYLPTRISNKSSIILKNLICRRHHWACQSTQQLLIDRPVC